MRTFKKKGQLDRFAELVMGLGILVITIAVILLIMAETRSQVRSLDGCANASEVMNATDNKCYTNSSMSKLANAPSATWNATQKVLESTMDVPGWLPIIVITLIGGILLGLVRWFKGNR